jgi:excisionase family DNA binding protein
VQHKPRLKLAYTIPQAQEAMGFCGSPCPRCPAEHERLPKLAYTIPQAQEVTGLSRSLIYEAIKLGELQSIKVRRRRLILHDDLLAWLAGKRVQT